VSRRPTFPQSKPNGDLQCSTILEYNHPYMGSGFERLDLIAQLAASCDAELQEISDTPFVALGDSHSQTIESHSVTRKL